MTTKAPEGLNPSKLTDIELEVHNLGVWDERRKRAADWLIWSHPSFKEHGLEPFPIRYRLISDQTMLDLTAYEMMMPTDLPHWSHGKRAEQQRKNAGNFHVFEAALNMKPAIVWLGVTNSTPMQVNVMAHAVDGHVALCAMNYMFAESSPETAFNRFAMWRQKVLKLIRDPRWGWEGVEYILDAANALDHHCGWLPTIPGRPTDDELREQLEAGRDAQGADQDRRRDLGCRGEGAAQEACGCRSPAFAASDRAHQRSPGFPHRPGQHAQPHA